MFGFIGRRTPQHNNNISTVSTHTQDEEEPYLAEVYGAMPVVDNSLLTESTSTKEVSLNFEGEDKDTFVLVSGLLGFNTIEITLPGGKQWVVADYWSDVKGIVEDPFISNLSPLDSIHDRAVELYYQIKGGQVDYGLQHSYQFCHNQFGATYEGFMPHWNPDNPVVLIGKGYGATTALYLQHLLSTNFFGQHTSGRMVKAVICLSAPHRGSTLPYCLGLEAGSKCIINPLSLLQLFLSFVHIVCYFACLDRLFSFQLNDKWDLSSREGGEQSIWSAISARSKFAYFGDNFLVDLSVEGARMRYAGEEKDKHRLDSDCVYVNYITTGSSWRSKITGHYWPRLAWRNLPTAVISIILGQYKMTSDVEQHVLRTSSSTFWENDGVLSVYSQQPPPHQRVLMNIAAIKEKLVDPVDHELVPGAWYNVYVEDRSNTLLFDDVATFPLVEQILEINILKNFGEYLSKNTDNFEYYYICLVEFLERQLCYLGSKLTKLTIKSNGDSSVTDIEDIEYITSAAKSCLTNASFDRIEKHTSDKAGEEWCRRIITMEIMNSPSKMLYYVNNIQKLYATVGVGGSQDLASFKDDFSASVIPSGQMFIKAKHKMTEN